MKRAAGLLLLCCVVLPVQALQAQDSAIPKRVEALEGQMRAVQRKVFPGGAPKYFEPEFPQTQPATVEGAEAPASSTALADINVRLQALEKQIAEITGRLEQNENRTRLLDEQFQKFKADIEFRLTQGAPAPAADAAPAAVVAPVPGPSPAPVKSPAATTTPATKAPATVTPPKAAPSAPAAAPAKPIGIAPSKPVTAGDAPYQAAYGAYQAKRYDDAISMFEDFVAKNPRHALASNALFWQGKAYAAKKQHGLAARSFLRGYDRYREADKAEENLLGLAESLTALDRREQACQALSEHQAVYKNASSANKAKAEALRKTAKCS